LSISRRRDWIPFTLLRRSIRGLGKLVFTTPYSIPSTLILRTWTWYRRPFKLEVPTTNPYTDRMNNKNTAEFLSKETITSYMYVIVYEGYNYTYQIQMNEEGELVSDIIRDENGYEIADPTLAENIVGFWENSDVEFPNVD